MKTAGRLLHRLSTRKNRDTASLAFGRDRPSGCKILAIEGLRVKVSRHRVEFGRLPLWCSGASIPRYQLMNTHRFVPGSLAAAVVISFFGSLVLQAQDERKRDRALRVLAVGQEPPWREVIQGGRRVQVTPPLGSLPPGRLQLSNARGAELGEAIGLRLNQISSVISVNSGTHPLHAVGAGGLDPKPWHKLKFPNMAAGLAILWRDPAKGKWTDGCKAMVLRDDLTGFPAGRIRIVNVSKYSLGLKFGTEKGLLKPGQVLLRAGKSGAFSKVPLELSVKDKSGRWVRVISQEINQRSEQRTHVVLYTNDGEAPSRPVGAVVLRETARSPAVKKPR